MISRLLMAACMAATANAAAAQTSQQFDLRCEGQRQLGFDSQPEAHSYGFRVDLAAGRWCWTDCDRTYPIVEAAPDRLVFTKADEDTPTRQSMTENSVSRQTGDHRMLWIESRPVPIYMETKGRCDPLPFSGFPSARF